ncbi:GNAT family N-acetyltransferase [Arthrobacter sp. ISL-30]|uniref:GNAT family N-acetyltransferase n=1 Tax=Arthrobacter sp. ISL-30 TaxID=2819109 RepID=UPI001BE51F2C|nr:GNAT family N-acetyltransferase [Arthrobacter sp. ISL-30]MBT2512854.1 GNAT family N-acetyltransferase [Arthrobacter sp. ISL-30]
MPASLAGSLAGVVAMDGDQVIGMGRLVGDGVKYFYVQDLAVLPSCQGQGVGRALLNRLMGHVARTAPASAFVGLFAAEAALPLYQRAGFTMGDMTGCSGWWTRSTTERKPRCFSLQIKRLSSGFLLC